MSRSLARAAPMRFLIAVTSAWTAGRGIALAGWQPDPPRPATVAMRSFARASSPTASPDATMPAVFAGVPPLLRPALLFVLQRPAGGARRDSRAAPRATGPVRWGDPPPLRLAAYRPDAGDLQRQSSGIVDARAVIAPPSRHPRFTGSAWAFLRGGGRATALSPGGQIGGGQMGARLLYRIDAPERLAIAARVSRTIGGLRQTEAAVGFDWTPFAKLPLHLMLDRRIAIDKGGRNAWTLGAAGGVYDVRVAPHWRLDGYGEAGVVGAHARDLYADGALRIARAIDLGGGRSLALGGGAWGAAQPGAARLDLGPTAVLRLAVAGHAVSAALDWRARTLGDARPGSGIAFTLATDF